MSKNTSKTELNKAFKSKKIIELKDFEAFYREKEPAIPKATINWRVHDLVQRNVFERVGRGQYRFTKTMRFSPVISTKMNGICRLLNKQFPFVDYCQWQLSTVNEFLQHLINFNILFVDVERDALDAAYYALKEQYVKVMLVGNLYDDLSEFNNYIIVRPLISDSPCQQYEKCNLATLEKILVDLATDKELIAFQSNEIYTIMSTAAEKYTINQSKMLRYAGRKNKREEIETVLKSVNYD